VGSRRPARGKGRKVTVPRSRPSVVPLDAEDIAMARLQAHLRKAEAIRAPKGRGGVPLARTTVRLSSETLQQLRDRARRDGATISEVVEVALERYLTSS